MPFEPPTPRKHIHTRTLKMEGFLREDGLWDIEGHLTDVKSYAFKNEWRGGEVLANEPIHDMQLRLTINDAFDVCDVAVAMHYTPYPAVCPGVEVNFQRLKGLRIAQGWNRKVRNLLGGVQGCTHLVEMLAQLATVALQTIRPYNRSKGHNTLAPEEPDPNIYSPRQINTCYSWDEKKAVVQRHLPSRYSGAASK